MRSRARVGGFTLVELLIVLAIVGTLVALVAPLGVRQIERTRAEEESLILERALRSISFKAFSEDTEIQVQTYGRTISWETAVGETASSEFEQLWFDRQTIVFNSNGIASVNELKFRQRLRERTISLNRGFQD